MSSTSLQLPVASVLPDYDHHERSPAYSRLPLDDAGIRTTQVFTKQSRGVVLEIYGQRPRSECPVFGQCDVVCGRVVIQKPEIATVHLKLDGFLRIQESGGSGRALDRTLGLELLLYNCENDPSSPSPLEFAVPLPATYSRTGHVHPLPPTIDVHLNSIPGFHAQAIYSITANVTKQKQKGNKSNLFGNITTVSTPFIYLPRHRPPFPISARHSSSFLTRSPDTTVGWECLNSVMESRSQRTSSIQLKLFIPAGRTFCMHSSIPFLLHIASNAFSLASFLPCAPVSGDPSTSSGQSPKRPTRVYVVRQISVDARNAHEGVARTDIFKTLLVGEGLFKRLGDGPDWAVWEGEVVLNPSVIQVGTFKVPGLWLRDFLIVSIVPPNLSNSPLRDSRVMVPIRLVTESDASHPEVEGMEWDGGLKVPVDFPEL